MKLTKAEEALLAKLLVKAKAKAPEPPKFELDKPTVKRISAALALESRLVLVRGKTGVTIYELKSYLSKVEFGQTRGVKTLTPGNKKTLAPESSGGGQHA